LVATYDKINLQRARCSILDEAAASSAKGHSRQFGMSGIRRLRGNLGSTGCPILLVEGVGSDGGLISDFPNFA
jgi:hypothetical protein